MAHNSVAQKKLFGPEKIIFGALGRHFFQTLVTFHNLRIFQKLRIKIVEIMLPLNTYHYQTAFKTWGFFKQWGLILIFWKLFSKLIYWSGDYKQVQGLFKKWGLNPQFLKTPQKAPWDWTKCLPSAQKMIFLGPNNFFCATEIWAMCFLQKTAPDLVKYGLHSLAYNLPPHIGGRHSVLYFTIQATKKYSNSNVLHQQCLNNSHRGKLMSP